MQWHSLLYLRACEGGVAFFNNKDAKYQQSYNLKIIFLYALGLWVTVQFMHVRIYCVSNQWWTLYNLVLLISIPTEQFSLPPQLPPRNFTPSENRDSHAEPVKTIEQSRVSIVDTYLQRVQHVDMSQYYMIYSMLSIPQYLTLLNYLYYKTIYTKMTNNTFNYDWYYGSVKNNEHWLGDHMAIYCVC